MTCCVDDEVKDEEVVVINNDQLNMKMAMIIM